MSRIKLREIAHSRAGDKGNTVNISLIVYNPQDYDLIRNQVTAERVADWFKGLVTGKVIRFELPNLGALNFVLYEALAGGVTISLRLDPHGKSLSSAILEMEIDID